jgi:predicted TIM-barrel fold metal-dependent hydrolase
MKRREFLTMSCGTLAGVALAREATFAQTEPNELLPIIDTHQHLWDFVAYKSPWLADADPKIAARHGTSEFLQATKGLNVTQAVYMEVDVAPADQVKEIEYITKLCRSKDHPTTAAVISGRPNSEQFAAYIRRTKDNPYIKGVRQVLHVPSAEAGLCLQPRFVASMRMLGEMGLSFDLCMRPTELAAGAELAGQCPETRFIVDHCGNADPKAWMPAPTQTPWHTVDGWKRDMEALAKRPNVVCKISGIVARAPQGWKPELLAPIVNFCLDTFGPSRVMFGGDWPVCKLGASYAEWVNGLKEIVHARPVAERRMLFHDNARTFYGLTSLRD